MNKLAKTRSPLFILIGWLLLVSSFADGANLDDLVPGTLVVHDTEDGEGYVQPQLRLLGGSDAFSGISAHHSRPITSKESKPSSHQSALRVILDQDSPSLAADYVGYAERFATVASDSQPVSTWCIFCNESLYLQYCSLLI